MFQVGYHLGHDTYRNSETVSGISTCWRIQHGIDTYQFTFRINQRTTTVTLIDSRIGLNERFYLISSQSTRFRTYHTGSHCRTQVERVTYCQYPLTYFQVVRVTYHDSREVISFNLYKCQVSSRVSTDDTTFHFASVVQLHIDFIRSVNHVVVRYDVTIL